MTLPGSSVGDPADLAQLLHQVDFVCSRPAVSASTRSAPRGRGRADGVEDDRARVAALAAAHEVGAGALGPRARAARRPRRGTCRRRPSRRVRPVVGLCAWRPCRSSSSCPTPFTPTNSHTFGWPGSKRRRAVAAARRALSSPSSASSSAGGSVIPSLLRPCIRSRSSSSRGRADADVGADQGLLEVVPGLGVDRRAAGSSRGNPAKAPRALPSRSRNRGLTRRLDDRPAPRPRRRRFLDVDDGRPRPTTGSARPRRRARRRRRLAAGGSSAGRARPAAPAGDEGHAVPTRTSERHEQRARSPRRRNPRGPAAVTPT